MSENLPINVDNVNDVGTITYATDVIAIIVGVATTEIEGITNMAGSPTISDILGRGKNLSRGVRVEVGAEEVAVDVSVIVDYGMPIQKVCKSVQENIRKSIETMTGLHVIKVDVHVQGVSFEKENKEVRQSQEMARLQSAKTVEPENEKPVKTEPSPEEPVFEDDPLEEDFAADEDGQDDASRD